MRRGGQVVILVAILIPVALLLLAAAVDAGRLYLESARLERAAQAGADAGMGWVADQMVTMAVHRQTEAASLPPCMPDAGFGTPAATCTATPLPQEVTHWLTEQDRQMLVSTHMQIAAQSVARDYAARNSLDANDPAVLEFQIQYPCSYDPNGSTLRMCVSARRRVEILLAGLLHKDCAELPVQAISEVQQR